MKQVNQVKLGAEFIKKRAHREMHDRCLWEARMRRDRVASAIPEWEEMRELASQIKLHTLSNLDTILNNSPRTRKLMAYISIGHVTRKNITR